MMKSFAGKFARTAPKALAAVILAFVGVASASLLGLDQSTATALVSCNGVPHNEGGSGPEEWYFDVTNGTCGNNSSGATDPTDGFLLITDEDGFYIRRVFNGGGDEVVCSASSCGATATGLTANSISPDITDPNIDDDESTSFGVALVEFDNVMNVTFNFTTTLTFQGVSYTILTTLTATTGDKHTVTTMSISGGAFGVSTSAQSTSQQQIGAHILFQQAGANIAAGVGNAIAERFFGGDGTQLSVSSNGSAASAYISMRGIGQAAQDMRARRLAMYETSPDALQAIDAAFLNASMEQSEERSDGAGEGSSHLLGYAGTPSFGEEESRWNIWARGTYSHYDGDAFSGDTWNGIAGVDYLLTETVLIGALAGYESGDFTFQTTNGAFDGAGFTTGVYVGVQLAENLVMDAFLTHAWLDYDNRAGTATGDTDATRLMVSVNVTGQYELAEGVILEPNARFFYAHEEQEAYILSDTTAVAANSIDSGRLSIGPRLRYAFQDSAYNHWSLFVSAHGEYDLSTENQTNTALPDFDGLLSARLGAGIDGTFYNGWSFSLAGDVGGIGSGDYLSYTGTGNIRIPLN